MPLKDRAARKVYTKKYLQRIAARRSRSYAENKTRLSNLKAVPCVDCGRYLPQECMDFDHVRGEKLFGVGHMIRHSNATFYAEVAKCELVCANCHRIRSMDWKETLKELRRGFILQEMPC